MIQILIVDEHPDVRAALANRLRSVPGVNVVDAVGDITDAMRWVYADHPGLSANSSISDEQALVALVEPKRTDGRGLELIATLSHHQPPINVIVLTSYPSEWERWAVERAGAKLYLLKDIGSTSLLKQILSVV